MAAESNPTEVITDPPESPSPPAAPPATSMTLTQEELQKLATREKQEGAKAGRQAYEKEVADKLGMTLEEAQKLVEAAKQKQEAEKSDAQKAAEAAATREAEAAKAKAGADAERHALKVERQLSYAGIAPRKDEATEAYQARVAKCTRLVDVEVGDDDEAIRKAVEAAKQEFPEIFGAAGQPPRAPSGDPQGTPTRKPGNEDAYERGKQRALDEAKKVGAT